MPNAWRLFLTPTQQAVGNGDGRATFWPSFARHCAAFSGEHLIVA